MKVCWYALLLFLVLPSSLRAQEPVITPETKVDSRTLHDWLHSNNPRLIARAADFARRRDDKEIIAEMPKLLDEWNLPSDVWNLNQSQQELRYAAFAVLDTLIQKNVDVPLQTIDHIAPALPTYAAILISHYPLEKSRTTLTMWAYNYDEDRGANMRGRIASMILAKSPIISMMDGDDRRENLVAYVVRNSEEELQIIVTSPNSNYQGISTRTIGDYIPGEPLRGWPEVYEYELIENGHPGNGPTVVDLAGDIIGTRRTQLGHPADTCCRVLPLNSKTRHRLIAYWLGLKDKDMPWQPVEHFTIQWTDQTSYQRDLGAILQKQSALMRKTVEELKQRNLIYVFGADIETIMPKLSVNIQCHIDPCPLQ